MLVKTLRASRPRHDVLVSLRRGSVILVALTIVLPPHTAIAQPVSQEEIEELKRKNNELEERIAALEADKDKEKAGEEGDIASSDEEELDKGFDLDLEAPGLGFVAQYRDVNATFQLFGDVGFLYQNPEPEEKANSTFFFGSQVVFVTAQIGEYFRVLSESNIHGTTENSVEFDQERLWGSWTFNDLLEVKLGVEHSPLTRWGRLYHHGKWFETSVGRPLLARFEGGGGILPMHNAGVELGGRFISDLGELEYVAAVSNGRGESPKDKVRSLDTNNEKAFDIALGFTPAILENLRIGGAFRYDDIPSDSGTPGRDSSIRALIGTGNVQFDWGSLETIAEFVYIDNEVRSTDTNFGHHSAYVQLGYRLGDWFPYTRFDYRNMENRDPFYMTEDRDLDIWQQIFGVRYDFTSNAAIKIEFGFGEAERRRGSGAISEGSVIITAVQLSWIL